MTGIRLAALDRAAVVAEKRLDVLVDFSAGHDRLQASCRQSRLALSRKNLDTTRDCHIARKRDRWNCKGTR
jgi:hypothetical protein